MAEFRKTGRVPEQGKLVISVRRQLLMGCALLGWSAFAPQTRAQTASQITPPSFAPERPDAPAPVVIPEGAGAQAPPGSEALEVTLADVIVDGEPAPASVVADIKRKLVGRPVKVSEIFAAARGLEADFARQGYVLARVAVPAQSLANGATLRLAFVNGFIERVDTSAVPARVRGPVAASLASLTGARARVMHC
ncbi:MAG: hypothetical protein B7Z15_17385 [Rhizobiales bacterium 32-66-8]|nr:MAG: hypothetical protein B7Z15_17385 [Rhizobiales bacterium 32-66-8]